LILLTHFKVKHGFSKTIFLGYVAESHYVSIRSNDRRYDINNKNNNNNSSSSPFSSSFYSALVLLFKYSPDLDIKDYKEGGKYYESSFIIFYFIKKK
jgi:hypothetical protein